MHPIAISAFQDNYIWMLTDPATSRCWVIDPGDATPVLQVLQAKQFSLGGILLTHHHYDHSGGVTDLLAAVDYPVPVYASKRSALSFVTDRLSEQSTVQCGNYHFSILEIPGHTLDHLAFYNKQMLFCGDTLFSAGCGKVFEGTPAMMYESLMKLQNLPDSIKIFCGHEYTLANLAFAKTVEPENHFILQKIAAVKELRDTNRPSLPSLLSEEKLMNPFLRCQEPQVIAAAEAYANKKLTIPEAVFAVLREWKNAYRAF